MACHSSWIFIWGWGIPKWCGSCVLRKEKKIHRKPEPCVADTAPEASPTKGKQKPLRRSVQTWAHSEKLCAPASSEKYAQPSMEKAVEDVFAPPVCRPSWNATGRRSCQHRLASINPNFSRPFLTTAFVGSVNGQHFRTANVWQPLHKRNHQFSKTDEEDYRCGSVLTLGRFIPFSWDTCFVHNAKNFSCNSDNKGLLSTQPVTNEVCAQQQHPRSSNSSVLAASNQTTAFGPAPFKVCWGWG